MINLPVEQGSYEWHEARRGIPTASEFKRIITSQGKAAAGRMTYVYELVAQRIMGFTDEQLENMEAAASPWMERGKQMESEAADFYALIRDVEPKTVGFCYLDKRRNIGASPDRFIGAGLLEIKCPAPHNHIKYLEGGEVPAEYVPQVQGQMWVTGRPWCDFMSYHPSLPPLIVRVEPDPAFTEAMSKLVEQTAEDVERITQKLKEGSNAAK